MQSALEIVKVWCDQNELSVNPDKAEAILFTRKTSKVNLKVLFFNGSRIKIVSDVKYLGVILGFKLN